MRRGEGDALPHPKSYPPAPSAANPEYEQHDRAAGYGEPIAWGTEAACRNAKRDGSRNPKRRQDGSRPRGPCVATQHLRRRQRGSDADGYRKPGELPHTKQQTAQHQHANAHDEPYEDLERQTHGVGGGVLARRLGGITGRRPQKLGRPLGGAR